MTKLVSTAFSEGSSRFSPDGRYFAYASNETGASEVFVSTYPPGGGKWLVSQAGGEEPLWRADGRELFFLSPGREMMAVDIEMGPVPVIGQPHRLFAATVLPSTNQRNRYWIAADGQRLLINSVGEGRHASPATLILNWTAELSER